MRPVVPTRHPAPRTLSFRSGGSHRALDHHRRADDQRPPAARRRRSPSSPTGRYRSGTARAPHGQCRSRSAPAPRPSTSWSGTASVPGRRPRSRPTALGASTWRTPARQRQGSPVRDAVRRTVITSIAGQTAPPATSPVTTGSLERPEGGVHPDLRAVVEERVNRDPDRPDAGLAVAGSRQPRCRVRPGGHAAQPTFVHGRGLACVAFFAGFDSVPDDPQSEPDDFASAARTSACGGKSDEEEPFTLDPLTRCCSYPSGQPGPLNTMPTGAP